MLLKNKISAILVTLLAWLTLGAVPAAQAQDSSKNVFFERLNDTEVRFFYDQNYFLVDRNCEFRSIERVAAFDKVNNHFNGDFKDIGPDGQVILTGTYTKGEKNGRFVAYHANQQVKWEVTFQQDRPVGYWNYFYPDGKPLLSVSFHDSTTRVVSLWDQRGKLQVNQGNGRYEFRNPIDGFSEYGFPFYNMKGRIKDGLPNGLWNIYYENPEAKQVEHVAEEGYKNGMFIRGYNYFDDANYANPVFSILPYNNFYRAETLLFKQCTYDDFTGFTMHLAEYFRSSFRDLRVSKPVDSNFAFEVRVRKDGTIRRVELLEPLPEELNNGFNAVLKSLSFFVPSFKDGEYIDDVATVYGRVTSTGEGSLHFQTDRIERKLEQE